MMQMPIPTPSEFPRPLSKPHPLNPHMLEPHAMEPRPLEPREEERAMVDREEEKKKNRPPPLNLEQVGTVGPCNQATPLIWMF